MVDQTSDDAIAAGLKKLLTDQKTYMQLCLQARARKFRSWADYIEKLLDHLPERASRQRTPVSAVSEV